jgi:hypothetical protein
MGHKKHRDIPMLSHEELQTLAPDGGPRFNRLIFSSSPYLLQHAENPVDWYPWGEEAFAAAARDDKPIFLSIGYATCHWCHVMARESFEDEEIAALSERSLCMHQSRPGGTPRPGQYIHERLPGHDRSRRLAPHGADDSRSKAVFCRHLLPQRKPAPDDRYEGPDIPG